MRIRLTGVLSRHRDAPINYPVRLCCCVPLYWVSTQRHRGPEPCYDCANLLLMPHVIL